VVALFLVATWVLLVVARPLAWWKVGMIAALVELANLLTRRTLA
jgi:hypothetical protein